MAETLSLDLDTGESTGAAFSPCRRYRYRLWRQWGAGPRLNVLMLNPSTADEATNDPTIERCERRARQLGCGGLIVTNLFAYRATLPRDMKAAADPVGPENDAAILDAAREAGSVLCAWGKDGAHLGRAAQVRRMLRAEGVLLYALRVSEKSGEPWHPLYLPYDLTPQPYQRAEVTP